MNASFAPARAPRPPKTCRPLRILQVCGAGAMLGLASTSQAQVQVDWVAPTRGVSIAVDAADNSFTADFEQALGAQITVTKRDVHGNLLWTSSVDQTDGTKWEAATWVAVDSRGDVLVSGTLMSGYSNPVEAASILLKFAANGTPLYRIVYESAFDGSFTRKLILDEDDNAYVLGMGSGPAGYVTKVKKFSSAGVVQWTWFDSQAIGRPVNFKFARNGDLVIASRAPFGSLNGYARIDRQGNEQWALAGVQSLTAGDAAGDALGNTYLVHGEYVMNGGTVIKKLDAQGGLLWEHAYASSGFRIEVGNDDRAVVSGFPNSGSPGAAFFKVDPAGGLLWANLNADGPLNLLLHAQMLLDPAGNAFLAASTLFEMAVCKVRAGGSSDWTVTLAGSSSKGIALGNFPGSLFVVGGTTARLIEDPTGIGSSYCIGAVNSTGLGASMLVQGSAAVADNDVELVAMHLPLNQPGIFLFGPNQTQLPFGDGFRCVGAPVYRVQPPMVPDPLGTVQRMLDLQLPPAAGWIVPGSTQHFQFWYRDPGGPGGTNFNLSDGYQVSFH